jgi:hypothetical protein
MDINNTHKEEKDVFMNKLNKRVYSLLLKKEMSVKDLAEEIYHKKNVRSGITMGIKTLLENKFIYRTDLGTITKEKTYHATLQPLLKNFEKEKAFLEVFLTRFWNPSRILSIKESLNEIICESLIIKELFKTKEKISNYSPKKDFVLYKSNKHKFWSDINFRDKFLDSIKSKGDKNFSKSIKINIRYDFLFLSFIIPENIKDKIHLEINSFGSPIEMIYSILNKN